MKITFLPICLMIASAFSHAADDRGSVREEITPILYCKRAATSAHLNILEFDVFRGRLKDDRNAQVTYPDYHFVSFLLDSGRRHKTRPIANLELDSYGKPLAVRFRFNRHWGSYAHKELRAEYERVSADEYRMWLSIESFPGADEFTCSETR